MGAVGASERLQTVIAGESLVNDGVAFVMFEARGQRLACAHSLKPCRSGCGDQWLDDGFGPIALLLLPTGCTPHTPPLPAQIAEQWQAGERLTAGSVIGFTFKASGVLWQGRSGKGVL